MFNILCFGDSNTHGYNPENGSRYDVSTRWTGRLGRELGEDFRIIEAGTNGMTAGFDEDGDDGVYFNGAKCLPTYLLTQRPLDGIVIMLGTNDTKAHFAASAAEITEKIRELIRIVRTSRFLAGSPVKIVIAAPVPLVIQDPPMYDMDERSGAVSRELAACYKTLADEEGVYFADAGSWGIELNPDGCHISRVGSYTFAKNMAKVLRDIFCRE